MTNEWQTRDLFHEKKDSDVGIKTESSPCNSRKIFGMNRQIKENTKVGTSLIDWSSATRNAILKNTKIFSFFKFVVDEKWIPYHNQKHGFLWLDKSAPSLLTLLKSKDSSDHLMVLQFLATWSDHHDRMLFSCLRTDSPKLTSIFPSNDEQKGVNPAEG